MPCDSGLPRTGVPKNPALLVMSLGPLDRTCHKSGYRTKNWSKHNMSCYSRGAPGAPHLPDRAYLGFLPRGAGDLTGLTMRVSPGLARLPMVPPLRTHTAAPTEVSRCVRAGQRELGGVNAGRSAPPKRIPQARPNS
ncbi:hypothetical protein NDU88_000109 [Pleurodeles waltl]|uniref:Uncharacterized protein n=1 Tax=Pleurodeles waltl TaxID=8319 RepID=A0AAV7VXG1_PLEWA|nr:hypothetical protein NDU88_000109 [Pleurodeles waltl]